MLLVGLTGGIASGKTTVSCLLAEYGAHVIDADYIAREVVMPGSPAWYKIRDHFGPQVLFADGSIDRTALGDLVFADAVKLSLLNEITHPAILSRIADRLEELCERDEIVVLDAALLLETRLAERADVIVVVRSPRECQLARLAQRGLQPGAAEARVAAQRTDAQRLVHADIVVDNEGALEDLEERVAQVWAELELLLQRAIAGKRS